MKLFSASPHDQLRINYAIMRRSNRDRLSPSVDNMLAERMLYEYIKQNDIQLLDQCTTIRICHEVDSLSFLAFYWLCVKSWFLVTFKK